MIIIQYVKYGIKVNCRKARFIIHVLYPGGISRIFDLGKGIIAPKAYIKEGEACLMFATKSHKIDYGNWISMNIIIFSIVFCEIFVFLLLLSITGEWHVLLKVMFWFLTIASLLISAYFIYARYQFADRGGGMQEKYGDCWSARWTGMVRERPWTSAAATAP